MDNSMQARIEELERENQELRDELNNLEVSVSDSLEVINVLQNKLKTEQNEKAKVEEVLGMEIEAITSKFDLLSQQYNDLVQNLSTNFSDQSVTSLVQKSRIKTNLR